MGGDMANNRLTFDLAHCLLAFQSAERTPGGGYTEEAEVGAMLWAETLLMLRGFMGGGEN